MTPEEQEKVEMKVKMAETLSKEGAKALDVGDYATA